MKKAIIIYNSRTGTTKKYAEEIALYLREKEIETNVMSIEDYSEEILENADFLLLGCWTSGLMFFLQHPDKAWKAFAVRLPNPIEAKPALFTTYKLLTGSMFRNMSRQLNFSVNTPLKELKSRDGTLSEEDKIIIDGFIA